MQLQDYIKYYIGCEVIVDGKERAKLIGGSFVPNSCNQIYYDLQTEEMKVDDIDFAMPYNDDADDPEPRVKPILRRLEDMTEEEREEVFGPDTHWYKPFDATDACDSKQWHKLISKGFDLYGLVDAGLAVDIKKM